MSADTVQLALAPSPALSGAAAAAAAALVPAEVPLVAAPAGPDERPPRDAVAHVAAFVGAVGAELVLVADEVVAPALADGTTGGLRTADVLRPALEAAAKALGDGVLEDTRTELAGDVLGEDCDVFALHGDGAAPAWFALRLRRPAVSETPPGPTSAVATAARRAAGLRVLYDVEMTLTAEIGRARLPVRHVLDLVPGSLLELDRTAGSPADVVVNGRLVARGEVVVVDESYGVKITEIVPGSDAG